MILSFTDALGFAAAIFTLTAFAQKSMLPMRMAAIAANLCFIGYGALGPYYPVLLLHLILLPTNLLRLTEHVRHRLNVVGPPERSPSVTTLPGVTTLLHAAAGSIYRSLQGIARVR